MTVSPEAFLDAARSFVGVRYRLHGSCREGVDCIGLVLAALAEAGGPHLAAQGYSLRNTRIDRFLSLADAAGLRESDGNQNGDVRLLRTGPAQYHCAITDGDAAIHAHAGLRKVVRQPIPTNWKAFRAFRLKGI